MVHTPTPEVVAYALSLFLRSAHVPLTDVLSVWAGLETLCAVGCARRPDRSENVVPALQRAHEACVAARDGRGTTFEAVMLRFHLTIAESCGNQTLTLLNGIMYRLWSAQEETWSDHADGTSNWPPAELRWRGLDYHARLVDAIERGDALEAGELMRELSSHPMHYGPSVRPSPLQDRNGRFTGRLHSAKAKLESIRR